MKTKNIIFPFLLLFHISYVYVDAAEVDTLFYFEEVDGIVVAEMESLDPASGWRERANRTGFTGTSFFEWTSSNQFGNPGRGLIQYVIKINNPGTYRFQWRCKVGHGSEPTESNDSWLRMPDASKFYAVKKSTQDTVRPIGVCKNDCPEGSGAAGWFKLYSSGTTAWTWTSRTSDSDPHIIYAEFDTVGFYRVQISGRSKNHLLDRFILHQSSIQNPTNLKLPETKVDHREKSNAKVIVKIKDSESKAPISSALVNLDERSNHTDGGGFTPFYAVPKDSVLLLQVDKDGYEAFESEISLNGDTTVQIKMVGMTTGLQDPVRSASLVIISPNPVKDLLRLQSSEFVKEVVILNMAGYEVFRTTLQPAREIEMNLSQLAAGSYFACILGTDPKGIVIKKFVRLK